MKILLTTLALLLSLPAAALGADLSLDITTAPTMTVLTAVKWTSTGSAELKHLVAAAHEDGERFMMLSITHK